MEKILREGVLYCRLRIPRAGPDCQTRTARIRCQCHRRRDPDSLWSWISQAIVVWPLYRLRASLSTLSAKDQGNGINVDIFPQPAKHHQHDWRHAWSGSAADKYCLRQAIPTNFAALSGNDVHYAGDTPDTHIGRSPQLWQRYWHTLAFTGLRHRHNHSDDILTIVRLQCPAGSWVPRWFFAKFKDYSAGGNSFWLNDVPELTALFQSIGLDPVKPGYFRTKGELEEWCLTLVVRLRIYWL